MSQKNLPILALKLLLSGGLILWITRDVALDSVFAVIESANLALLGLAFSLFFVGYIISAFRWRTLMRAQGGNAPILYLIRSFMVAHFFNNFLPSTVGGDVVRMYDSWRVGGSKSDAVAVVLVDRFLGVLVLLCFALIALTLDQAVVGQIPLIGWWVAAGIGGAILLAWLALNIPAARIDTLATTSGGLAK
ncbi:MAG: lysylphosphatidylglycerol synthase transmembrane domain-containing protein, partial [Arenicellales bacterium]|nr:lysylphosphatidylglycerol synthase transmembrane domain-containing protein [Arenicellales bacterium]